MMDENTRLLTEIRDAIRANGEQSDLHFKANKEMRELHFRTLMAEYRAMQERSKRAFGVLTAPLLVIGAEIGVVVLARVIAASR